MTVLNLDEFNMEKHNRRNFYRLHLKFPLCAEMTIAKFNNEDVNLGYSKSLIEDISLGGLRFLSTMNLPAQRDLILRFETRILDEQINFTGYIVWKKEVNNLFQYGLEFNINDKEREKFTPILNRLTIQLNKNSLSPSCDFLMDSKIKFLKG